MAKVDSITPEVLRELLEYNPETGKLYWRVRDRKWFKSDRSCSSFNARDAGKEAMTASKERGHKQGIVLGKQLLAHRVAWAIYYGEWPKKDVDHKNCVPYDNRILNLREATDSQNASNKHLYRNNTSGLKGASWHAPNGKWAGKIRINKKLIHLGYFESVEAAHAAYCEAAKKYHGEFARTE